MFHCEGKKSPFLLTCILCIETERIDQSKDMEVFHVEKLHEISRLYKLSLPMVKCNLSKQGGDWRN